MSTLYMNERTSPVLTQIETERKKAENCEAEKCVLCPQDKFLFAVFIVAL